MGVAIALGLLVGIAVGFFNGVVIAYTGIHPFVVTLATQSILRGAAYLIADGQPVPLYANTDYPKIGTGMLGIIPYPIIYMLIFFFLQYLLLNKTKAGRYIYAVGGNATAAQFSGINIKMCIRDRGKDPSGWRRYYRADDHGESKKGDRLCVSAAGALQGSYRARSDHAGSRRRTGGGDGLSGTGTGRALYQGLY